jgi:hypothetical protein
MLRANDLRGAPENASSSQTRSRAERACEEPVQQYSEGLLVKMKDNQHDVNS